MKVVWIEKGRVCEIIPEYALPVEKWYSPDFAAACVEASDEVQERWTYDSETGSFAPPAPELEPEPDPEPALSDIVTAQQAQIDQQHDTINKLIIAALEV